MKIWEKLSLRVKLTLLYSGLLAVVLSIIAITYYFDIRNLLITKTASDLRARAKPIIEHWLYQNYTAIDGKKEPDFNYLLKIAGGLSRDLTSRNSVAVILDKNNKIIANGKRLPEEPDPPKSNSEYLLRAFNGNNEITYIIHQKNQNILVLLIPLRKEPTSDKILGVAQISSPLTSIEKVIKSHSIRMVFGIIITLLLGSGLGYLIISSALRSLKRMTITCDEISDGKFGQRVKLPHYNDEIGQLARAFDNMINRIESTLNAQKRFLANAAHELRTPLTALKGSLQVLLRGAQDNPASVAKLSQSMYREVSRLERLCEKLLNLTRLEGYSSINKKSLYLHEFFREITQQLQILLKDRKLIIKNGPFVILYADPDLLKQVIIDLVDNAVKYTPNNGTIIIEWDLIKESTKPDSVKLYIKDNGEGIPNKDIPHIFEPFYRGKNALSPNKEGTGLGLTSVQAIIKAHNGTIDVKSELMKGTTFTIILPIQ